MSKEIITEVLAENTAETSELNTETAAVGKADSHAEEGGIKLLPSTIAFQALNFIVLLIILNKLVFKPVLKMLAEREEKIRQGVENAEKAKFMVQESNEVRADILKNAKSESLQIIDSAKKSAENLKMDILGKANEEAEKIISAGNTVIEAEKTRAGKEIQSKVAEMVVAAAEKILKEKIDDKKDFEMVEATLKEMRM